MNRVYNQYRNKPKAEQWLNIVPQMAGDLESTLEEIRTSYDIDNVTGATLEALEALVVTDTANIASIPPELDETRVRQLLVKAKISRNNTDASYEGIAEALQFITGTDKIEIIDREDMTFLIYFGRELTEEMRFILGNFDIIPRPNGVDFLGYDDSLSSTQFGGDDSQFGGDTSQFGFLFGGQ